MLFLQPVAERIFSFQVLVLRVSLLYLTKYLDDLSLVAVNEVIFEQVVPKTLSAKYSIISEEFE